MRNVLSLILIGLLSLVFASSAKAQSDALLAAEKSISEAIDFYVDLKLKTAGVEPAPLTDDANLLRRTLLDLVGRIPTSTEAKAYVEDDATDKRSALVERLMASPGFIRHQANEFDALLMNTANGSVRDYLLGAFRENRPWDQMFRHMLLGDDAQADQKGANQFVISRVKDIDKLTIETSVLFFGVNISCAKCHDHPLAPDWTQDHFYGMMSFFNRSFENGGFLGERDYGLVSFKTTDGESKQAQMLFLSGAVVKEPDAKAPTNDEKNAEKKQLEELKKNKQPPPPPAYSRRAQLVEAALKKNEQDFFSRAIVNHLWNRFFGMGLVSPVDQMHSDNPASHPQLLRWLARDMVEHQYDLKRLIRGLVESNAYARSSRWDQENRPPPQLFAVASPRPLSPYQYAAALQMGSENPDSFPREVGSEDFQKRIEAIEKASKGLAGQFEQPGEDFQISVDEALLMANGDRIQKELLKEGSGSIVEKMKQAESPAKSIEAAFWAVLSRSPDAEEATWFQQYLTERKDRSNEAYRQVVWALLTSSENRFNY